VNGNQAIHSSLSSGWRRCVAIALPGGARQHQVTIKLRHAAALALAGWYLMVPASLPNGQPDVLAPLSRWKMDGSYDTVQDCNRRHRTDLQASLRWKHQTGESQAYNSTQAEKCVSDDLRLAR